MASSVGALTRTLLKSLNSAKCVNIQQMQGARFLYSKATLGLEGYKVQRERTQNNLANISDKFRQKMKDYSADDSQNMIFTEDLKNMVYMAKSDEDVDIVVKMMKKFNKQNKELRFGNFVFGPVVMRMFHTLNKPDEALASFNNPDMQGFFDQLMSYQLLLDLLFDNKKYNEIIKTFDVIKERQIEGTRFPRNIVVLYLAACYKLNTPESLNMAIKLWKDLAEIGHLPMRRAITFYAGLAFNQANYPACLEILSASQNQNYTTIRNLKVAALTKMGRIEDTLPILKSILREDVPTKTKHTFNKEVLDMIKTEIEKNGNTELKTEFERLQKIFAAENHISEETLDQQLCSEISQPPFITARKQQHQYNNNRFQKFDQDRPQRKTNFKLRRPGLSELQ